jgi:antitoxin (DNA-binding transcriptional repressor) of toxin-antitoxin stability system
MKIPVADAPCVGIREFRAALAEYIDADTPVTVTRHGQAVGLFVPLRRPSADDVQRVQQAAANFRKAVPLSEHEVEEMVADFDALRRGRPLPRRSIK